MSSSEEDYECGSDWLEPVSVFTDDSSTGSDSDDQDNNNPSEDHASPPAKKGRRHRGPPRVEWQESKGTVAQRLMYLLNREDDPTVDVTFLVGPEEKPIYGHKLILAAASPYFYKLFYGSMATKESVTKIVGRDYEVFLSFLKYVYGDALETKKGIDHVLQLLELADMYIVPQLATKCKKFLGYKMTPENVLRIFKTAEHLDFKELKIICWYFIRCHAKEVMQSDDFVNLDHKTLCRILGDDYLNIHEETDVLKHALRWSVLECGRKGFELTTANQVEVLGKAFDLIRFSAMSLQGFSKEVPVGLLKEEEAFELLKYLASPLTTILQTRLWTKARNLMASYRWLRRVDLEGKWVKVCSGIPLEQFIQRSYKLRLGFTVDRWVTLRGVSVHKIAAHPDLGLACAMTIKVERKEDEKSESSFIASLTSSFEARDYYRQFRINGNDRECAFDDEEELDRPVSIQPGIKHIITAELKVTRLKPISNVELRSATLREHYENGIAFYSCVGKSGMAEFEEFMTTPGGFKVKVNVVTDEVLPPTGPENNFAKQLVSSLTFMV